MISPFIKRNHNISTANIQFLMCKITPITLLLCVSTFSSLGDPLQPWNYFAAHRVFIVATHHFIQIKIWEFETMVSLEFLYYI